MPKKGQLKKHTVDQSASFNMFTTPNAGYSRNAAIKYKAGSAQPSVLYTKLRADDGTTISPAVKYGYVYGFDDIEIPPGADQDWTVYNSPPFKDPNIEVNPPDCSPDMTSLANAWDSLKHKPELMQNIVNSMVGCERRYDPGGSPATAHFDKPLEEQKAVWAEVAKSNATAPPGALENKQYGTWLQNQAKKAGLSTGHPLFAYLSGPEYFLTYAKGKGSTTHAALPASAMTVPIENYALDIADGVILLSALDRDGTQNAIYTLTRNFGEDYGQRLDQMMSIFDATVAKAKFGKKKQLLKYGMLPSIGLTGQGAERGAGKRAYSQSRGKEQRKRRGERAAAEAELDFDVWSNDVQIANANTITEAIEDFLACAGQFEVRNYSLHVSQYGTDRLTIRCGNTNFAQDNPRALADALTAELLAQQGESGSKAGGPPPPDDKKTLLPWIVGGIGLVVGGPIGAGAGYALGTALEKK